MEERGEGEKIWGSMIKQTLKRRKPGFSESYYGFRSFSQLLEEAQARGILELEPEEKSGGYIIKSCHVRHSSHWSDFRKCSKKAQSCSLDSGVGSWVGRLVMATRFV